MMLDVLFKEVLNELSEFTDDLEREKSYTALNGIKCIWRIVKSIQLKHVHDLEDNLLVKLDRIISSLDIVDVAPTSYSVEESKRVLCGFKETCSFRHEHVESD